MMNAHIKDSSRFWLFFAAALLALTAGLLLIHPFFAATADSEIVTRAQGGLHLSIPYHAVRAGSGLLTMEVLDPDDAVLAHTERRAEVAAGQGRWLEQIRLDKPMPLDALVWQRLRYRFAYDDNATQVVEGT